MSNEEEKGLLTLGVDGSDVVLRDHEGKEAFRVTPDTRSALVATLDAMAWSIDEDGMNLSVGGACPVQGDGTVDGLPIYFRARSDGWSFSIAQSSDLDPVNVSWETAPGWWTEGDYGQFPDAGWMSGAHSQACVRAAVARWRALGGPSAPLGIYVTTGAPTEPEPAPEPPPMKRLPENAG